MVAHPGQILDQQRHARECPQGCLVSLGLRSGQQGLGDPGGLLGRQLGFAARRTFAGQSPAATLFPGIPPTVGNLSGYTQPPRNIRSGNILAEQFSRLFAALFHRDMVSCGSHAQSLHLGYLPVTKNVTLLYESQ